MRRAKNILIKEITDEVGEDYDLKREQVKKIIDRFIDKITEGLVKKEEVVIDGLGKFWVDKRRIYAYDFHRRTGDHKFISIIKYKSSPRLKKRIKE